MSITHLYRRKIISREEKLRHNLGEYYTPDWLAERLLNMFEGRKFSGNPDKRIIDPTCGSQVYSLVITIKKIREYAEDKKLPKSTVLEKILSNVFEGIGNRTSIVILQKGEKDQISCSL